LAHWRLGSSVVVFRASAPPRAQWQHIVLAAYAMVILFLGVASAQAQVPLSSRQVVLAYVKELEAHKLREAVMTYISPDFKQHSPHIADGRDALLRYHESKLNGPGGALVHSTIFHILADGDLVLLHRHQTRGPGDRGMVYADLFRVKNGQIVEHWDVIQPVPDKSVSGNTMW
jgi:predicted SnoaL-like aldol condensation-catalyzing enzyme